MAKFFDRNGLLPKNNNKSISKHVPQILQTKERVWNTLPNGNRSRELPLNDKALWLQMYYLCFCE